MKVASFCTRSYDREFRGRANAASGQHKLTYIEAKLNGQSAALSAGHGAVCAFVNDHFDRGVLETLAAEDVRLVPCSARASTTSTEQLAIRED